MNPYKILIIEDDAKIRDELQILLQANGYITAFVEDFSNVKDIFHAEQPRLVLLDITLPNASEFSICSQIRSISNVPIIFVTSCNTDMDELNSILLGGDAFIAKPYHTAQFYWPRLPRSCAGHTLRDKQKHGHGVVRRCT